MIVYTNMLLSVSSIIDLYPKPVNYTTDQNAGATFLWLTIEYTAFVSIVLSNILFLLMRSFVHHKI